MCLADMQLQVHWNLDIHQNCNKSDIWQCWPKWISVSLILGPKGSFTYIQKPSHLFIQFYLGGHRRPENPPWDPIDKPRSRARGGGPGTQMRDLSNSQKVWLFMFACSLNFLKSKVSCNFDGYNSIHMHVSYVECGQGRFCTFRSLQLNKHCFG